VTIKSKIFNNSLHLSAIKLFEILYPIILLPILISAIGLERYGTYVFFFTISQLLIILINFGFDEYLPPKISRNLDVKKYIVDSVIIKLFVFMIALIIISVGFFFWREVHIYYFLAISFAEVFNLYWYFQGKQNFLYFTVANFVSKLTVILTILAFVTHPDDWLIIPIILSLVFISANFCLFIFVINKEKIKFKDFLISKFTVSKRITNISLTNIFISLKDKMNVFFISTLLTNEILAIYDVLQKILILIQQPVYIVQNAIFPEIAKAMTKSLLFKGLFVALIYSLFIYLAIFVLSYLVIDQMLPSFDDALYPLLINNLSIFFYCIAFWITKNVIIINSDYKVLFQTTILTTVFYFFCILVTTSLNYELSLISFCIINLLVYMFEALTRIFVVMRRGYFENYA